jgi:hypothetical protein
LFYGGKRKYNQRFVKVLFLILALGLDCGDVLVVKWFVWHADICIKNVKKVVIWEIDILVVAMDGILTD